METDRKKNFYVSVLIMILLGAASCKDGEDNAFFEKVLEAPVVITSSGVISGIMNPGAFAYLGVPYAAPPVGDLRWRVAQPAEPWDGVLNANSFCPACPQDVSDITNLYGLTDYNEDCLYLNVWTPRNADSDRLPVMFWIHGGGFVGGSASLSMYNGSALAQKGVVVVTANYRLGPLGYMVHDELHRNQGKAGNYGLYDIIAVLEWIRDNISAFGGDPDNVTVFGESAGGCAITLLQNAPIAQGLYNRAIAQSGTGSSSKYLLNMTGSWEEAAFYGDQLQGLLGAADIWEMRNRSAEEIIEAAASAAMPFGPVMDGVFLDGDPRTSATGPAHAPMITGSVRDEGTLFIYEYGIETLQDYEQALGLWFGQNAGAVQAAYPAADNDEAIWQAVAVHGLAGIQEPVRHTARAASLSQTVYRYYFNYVPPTETAFYLGGFHGSELAYVFGVLDPAEGYLAEDAQLSDQIMDLWASFAKTGVPAANDAPEWPDYASGQEPILRINGQGNFDIIYGFANGECDFFESIAPFVPTDYP